MIEQSVKPSRPFRQSIAANIQYWKGRTMRLDDQLIQALAGEKQNLYRAAEFGIHVGETWSDATKLILQCFYFVERRGFWNEWIPLLQDTLARYPGGSPQLKARLNNNLGACYRLERQFDLAIQSHLEEMELASRLEDERLIALAHNNLSKTYYLIHQYDDAEKHGLATISYFENRSEDIHRLAAMLNLLGLISQARGDSDEAESHLLQAVEKFRMADIPLELARAIANLAITLDAKGEHQSALASYQEAAELLAPTNYGVDKARLQLSMGTLFFNLDDLVAATSAYEKANSPYMRREGPTYYQAAIVNNLGNVYLAQERFPEAESYLREAIALWRQSSAHLMLANSLGTLAETMVATENYQDARKYYEEALEIAEQYPEDAWSQKMVAEFKQERDKLTIRSAVEKAS
jgi:tetratricopeptide (TPR) repeat protein